MVNRLHNTTSSCVDQLEVPNNRRKRLIDSMVKNDEGERLKKRVTSSDDAFYGVSVPERAELSRLLGQLTPVQRIRLREIVQAAAIRAAKAMKEYLRQYWNEKNIPKARLKMRRI